MTLYVDIDQIPHLKGTEPIILRWPIFAPKWIVQSCNISYLKNAEHGVVLTYWSVIVVRPQTAEQSGQTADKQQTPNSNSNRGPTPNSNDICPVVASDAACWKDELQLLFSSLQRDGYDIAELEKFTVV